MSLYFANSYNLSFYSLYAIYIAIYTVNGNLETCSYLAAPHLYTCNEYNLKCILYKNNKYKTSSTMHTTDISYTRYQTLSIKCVVLSLKCGYGCGHRFSSIGTRGSLWRAQFHLFWFVLISFVLYELLLFYMFCFTSHNGSHCVS